MFGIPWERLLPLLIPVLVVVCFSYRRRSSLPFPPGPKGLPIIGNIFDIPEDRGWEVYAQWGRQLGSDVIHLNVLGSHLVIVNTAKAAHDLFEQRSALYSDRPQPVMLIDLVGFDWSVALMPYDDRWRDERKKLHQSLNSAAIPAYEPGERKSALDLLQNLLRSPEHFLEYTRLSVASMILRITYGIEIDSPDDPHVTSVEELVFVGARASVPGAFLVDFIPCLKNLPEWFPGAGFKRQARIWRKRTAETLEAPYIFAKNAMATGDYLPSIMSTMVGNIDYDSDIPSQEAAIQSVCGNMYVGGAATSVAVFGTFFLAMTLFPAEQKAAQEEIDRVIGHNRLPDFSDRSSLPYINALIKEVMRWRPGLPIALPHRLVTTSDDIYNGRHIPAGSTVIGNTWAILHDETVYPDPETFKPERFLKNGVLDPTVPQPECIWGYGRRVCPGQEMAMSFLFITISSILATFDITNAVDQSGKPIVPKDEFTGGVLRNVVPFECCIKPRSSQAVQLILSENDA